MSKLKTPQFVDTIETRAQKAFVRVKDDVEHIEQEQLIQNQHIEEIYRLLKELEKGNSSYSSQLNSIKTDILNLQDNSQFAEAILKIDQKLALQDNSIKENEDLISSFKEILLQNKSSTLQSLQDLKEQIDLHRIDVAKEILSQFTLIREEFLKKDELMMKEFKQEIVTELKDNLRDEVRKELFEELQTQFVHTDEYSSKIKAVNLKFKETKDFVHTYTASQVSIIQQQIEMLKEALEQFSTQDSQERIVTIIETLTQKVEEIDSKVDSMDSSLLEGQLKELQNTLEEVDLRVQFLEQEEKPEQNNELIEEVKNSIDDLYERIDQLDSYTKDEIDLKVEELQSHLVEDTADGLYATKDDLEELKIDHEGLIQDVQNEMSQKEQLIMDTISNIEKETLQIDLEIKKLDDKIDSIEVDVPEIDLSEYVTKDELSSEISDLDAIKLNRDEIDTIRDEVKEEIKEEVRAETQEMIDNIEIDVPEAVDTPEIDLSNYVTKDELSTEISDLDAIKLNRDEIDTLVNEVKDEIRVDTQEMIDSIEIEMPETTQSPEIDLSEYVRKDDLNNLYDSVSSIEQNVSTLDVDKLNRVEIEDLKSELQEELYQKVSDDVLEKTQSMIDSIEIDVPEATDVPEIDLSNYVTKDDLNSEISDLDAIKLNRDEIETIRDEMREEIKVDTQEMIDSIEIEMPEVETPEIPEVNLDNYVTKDELNSEISELDAIKLNRDEIDTLVNEVKDEIKVDTQEMIDSIEIDVPEATESPEIDLSEYVTKVELNEVVDSISEIDSIKLNRDEIDTLVNEVKDEIKVDTQSMIDSIEIEMPETPEVDLSEYVTRSDLSEIIENLSDLEIKKVDREELEQSNEDIKEEIRVETQEMIDNIEIETPEINFDDYVTKEELDLRSSEISNEIRVETQEMIDNIEIEMPEVTNSPEVDLSDYVTREEMNVLGENISDIDSKKVNREELDLVSGEIKESVKIEITDLIKEEFKGEVKEEIRVETQEMIDNIEIEMPEVPEVDLSDYVTRDEMSSQISEIDSIKLNRDEIDSIKEEIKDETRVETQEMIDNIEIEMPEIETPEIPEVDLSEYVTKEEINYLEETISDIDLKKVNRDELEEIKDEVKEEIRVDTQEMIDNIEIETPEIPEVDLSDYVTKDEMSSQISEIDSVKLNRDEIDPIKEEIRVETQEMIDNIEIEMPEIEIPEVPEVDLSDYVTKDEMSEVIENISDLDVRKVDREELEQSGDDIRETVKLEIKEEITEQIKEEVEESVVTQTITQTQKLIDEIEIEAPEIDTSHLAEVETVNLMQETIENLSQEIESLKDQKADRDELTEIETDEYTKHEEFVQSVETIEKELVEVRELLNNKEDLQTQESLGELRELIDQIKQSVEELNKEVVDFDIKKVNVEDIPNINFENIVTQSQLEYVEDLLKDSKDKMYSDLNSYQSQLDLIREKVEVIDGFDAQIISDVLDGLKETVDSQQIQIDDLSKIDDLSEEIKYLEDKIDSQLEDLRKGSLSKDVESRIEEIENKKVDLELFNTYIRFKFDSWSEYSTVYTYLVGEYIRILNTIHNKKEFKSEMKKLKKGLNNLHSKNINELRDSYDRDLVDSYDEFTQKSIDDSITILTSVWDDESIDRTRNEGERRAKEVSDNSREEYDDNFFTWFAFNKK